MHDFREDHLALTNQLVCSSMRRITSPALRFIQLSLVLSIELRPFGFAPMHLGVFTDIIHVIPFIFHIFGEKKRVSTRSNFKIQGNRWMTSPQEYTF